jgi:hypothetical protein
MQPADRATQRKDVHRTRELLLAVPEPTRRDSVLDRHQRVRAGRCERFSDRCLTGWEEPVSVVGFGDHTPPHGVCTIPDDHSTPLRARVHANGGSHDRLTLSSISRS